MGLQNTTHCQQKRFLRPHQKVVYTIHWIQIVCFEQFCKKFEKYQELKKMTIFHTVFFFKKHAIQLFMSNIFSKTRYNLPWVIVISIDCCKCPEAQW